jgi:hypothetical protein
MPEPWDTILMVVVIGLTVAMMGGLGFLGYLVWRDTKRGYGKWGVNRDPIHCPRCEEPAPIVRIAANWRQFWWGGHTCRNCGCEYDKWGKPIELPQAGDLGRFRPRPTEGPRPASADEIRKRDDLQEGRPE